MVSMYNKGFARIPVPWAEDIFTKHGIFRIIKLYYIRSPGQVLCPSRVCFLISCIVHQLTVPARILCLHQLDDALIQADMSEICIYI